MPIQIPATPTTPTPIPDTPTVALTLLTCLMCTQPPNNGCRTAGGAPTALHQRRLDAATGYIAGLNARRP